MASSSSPPLILAFDLGTTNFKAGLYEHSGSLVDLARRSTPIKPGPVNTREMQVDQFFECLDKLVDDLRQGDLSITRRVSLVTASYQANSFTLLDQRDRPVMPIMMWNDTRAKPSVDTSRLAGDYRQTGVPEIGPGFLPVSLNWLGTQAPSLVKEAHRVAMVGDLFSLHVSGQHMIDAAAAGLTGMLDIHNLTWLPTPLNTLGVSATQLPVVGRPGADVGAVKPEVAERWGLNVDCRYALGCLDQLAAAFGAGNVEPGRVTENTGTVLSVLRLSERFDPAIRDSGVFQGPTWRPGLYYRMLFTETSAGLVDALRQTLPGSPSIEELDRMASLASEDCGGLRLADSAVPSDSHWFEGESPQHGPGERVRAIYEGVASKLFGLLDVIDDGQPLHSLTSSGGAAASSTWLGIKARRLGCPVHRCPAAEPAAAGIARLAAGTG